MEHYEDYPWCPYSDHSGGETDDEHRHDVHVSKVQTRSISCSRYRSSFLVDELDMLMDKAATTIQAAWRGFLVRKRVWTENKAASTIQAAWRHFITREYMALQRDQMPSWQVCGRRRRTPSPASSEEGRLSRPKLEERREEAASVIQAHYRGYVTRRVLTQCSQAATTIQAHWRGYHTRQNLARGLTRRTYPSGIPSGTYYSRPRPVCKAGSFARLGPYPRKHWQKCLVGTPEEWKGKVPCPMESKHMEPPPQSKSCPKCGRCTTVRVLEGVGKGPPFESDSEFEGSSRPLAASYHARRRSPGPRQRQKSPRHHACGVHVSYKSSTEDQPRRQGRDPGGLSQRYPSHTAARTSKERTTSRSLSSTSVHQQGPPAPGTSDWLYENYCAHRMGEGQRRVFKTRKHMWEVARAATRIQSFWRGWKARQALRQQERAAIRIQSAYRGYKTRVYLIDAGILSEGYITD